MTSSCLAEVIMGIIFTELLGHMDAKKIRRICQKIEMDEI